jgi:hypothetical protein
MDWCESIADRRIREAIEAGAFDNLPHHGKPIRIESNPFEDSSRMDGASSVARQWVRASLD